MDKYIELDPQTVLASLIAIEWVERDGKKVEYWGGGEKHKIEYANSAAAKAAVDAFLAAADPHPAPAGGLVVGDLVQVSHHDHFRGALGEQFDATLLAFPTVGFPFWVIQTPTQVMYVDHVTVSKVT